MAENEILDIKGSRWRRYRQILGSPDSLGPDIAKCAADELVTSLRRDLNKALHKGGTLYSLLKAADEDPAALRAAVANFSNRSLGRITADAIKLCGEVRDNLNVARQATDLLLKKTADKAIAYACELSRYSDPEKRRVLASEIRDQLGQARSVIIAQLEVALRGEKIKPTRRSRNIQAPLSARVGAVLNSSLLSRGQSNDRHRPR